MRSFLYCGIVTLFLNATAVFQARANTLVVVLRTEQASIIAADSKVSTTQGGEVGFACKINITNDLVWATAGVYQETRGPFNILTIGETAIRQGGNLDEIVSRFARVAHDQLTEMLPRLKMTQPPDSARLLEQYYVLNSVFIRGSDLRTEDFLLPNPDIPQNIETINGSCPGTCPVGGNANLIIFGMHDAASAEANRTPTWSSDGIIGTINHLMDVQHDATPASVGGPVSILRIDKSGALSWLQKGMCN